MTEDEMIGWYDQLNGHEFEQALGVGEGQGSLVYCSPQGHKESDMTEQLNNNKLNQLIIPSIKSALAISVIEESCEREASK